MRTWRPHSFLLLNLFPFPSGGAEQNPKAELEPQSNPNAEPETESDTKYEIKPDAIPNTKPETELETKGEKTGE